MSYQLPPLNDEVEFERLVRDVIRRVYDDPTAERFGREGQAQHGIDGFSPSQPGVTFQCKLKDTRYKSDDDLRGVLLSEMEKELEKTKGLTHPPRRFIFATTFKNDTHLQQKAVSLSTSSVTVEYWGWDTISERIWEHAESLIPTYYPSFPIRPVPGFRQINHNLIAKARAGSADELNKLAAEYYRINDRSEVVFRVVCNDLDVRNDKVMGVALERMKAHPSGGTLWILGDGGSGKTTILHRLALELAQRGDDVFMLDLETLLSGDDLETTLSWLKYCSTPGRTALCIDNPAADDESLEALLRRVPDYCPEIHILLAERTHRYHALTNAGSLTFIHGEEEQNPIYVRNSREQRQKVYGRLFEILGVSDADAASLRDIVLNERLVYVNATYSVLLELKRKRKIDFDFDWDDYAKSTADLPAFREGYKYIALFYLFGVRTPFAVLSKLLGADETHRKLFLERFRGLVNEPIIVDERRDESFRKTVHVRTKHEIVSEIFFLEHPGLDKNELLMELCERTDFEDALEAQALVNIFGAKKNYSGENTLVDFGKLIDFLLRGHLRNKVALSSRLYAVLHLGKFWLLLLQGKPEEAVTAIKAFLETDPKDLHSRTELAKVYQRQNKLDEAEAVLLELLELEADSLMARTELAKVYQRENRLGDAEAVLLKLLELDANNLQGRTELAKVYQRQGRLGEAKAVLVRLLEIEPHNMWAHTELAKVYQKQGGLTEAEGALLNVLRIKPRDLNSRTELAKVYQRQGRLGEAEASLLKILDIEPHDLNSRTELAKVYQRQNKLDEAEAVLLELLELDANNLQARTELARVYQRQGRLAEAIRRLEEEIELAPEAPHPWTELAKVYQRQNRLGDAEVVLLDSLEIDANRLHPRTELAKVYQRQGKLAEAEAVLLKSLEIDANQLHPRVELAMVYQRQGRLGDAEAVLLKCLEIDPNQLHPRTELAKVYQRQNKLDEAEAVLLELLELEADSLMARTELTKVYQRQGRLGEAEAVLLESLEIDPNRLHARTELAKIYQRQGRLAEAEAMLLKSLEIDPNQLHPRVEIARVYQRQGRLDEAEKRAEEVLAIEPLNDHAISELLAIWERQGAKDKCTQRFLAFIDQPNYRFSRYSQAPVFRFFRCCRAFGMKEHADTVFERFESELDNRNLEFYRHVFR